MINPDYPLVEAGDITPLPLPAPLRLRPSFPFVGRPRELAALRSLVPRADNEGRRIALIGGEPGSGKSRLVREFAGEAADAGTRVLYGACDADVRTPYRPVVEALDQVVRMADPDELRDDLGAGGGELTRLLPDLPDLVGALPEPVMADQDTERHRLNQAVADLLVAASRRRPLLLVLEDCHWADTPTLLLLRHLARGAADARMLLVATFRDTEADVPAELSDTLVELRRSEGVVRLHLSGLTAEEVAEFVLRTSGATAFPDLPELAAAISDLTQGNAFLMTELWRAMIETGTIEVAGGIGRLTRPLAELATPDTVRELVSGRLARLDEPTRELLELAAVTGPEFELRVLRDAAGADAATLASALEQAARNGIIDEVPARTLRYRFTHELVRRALYDRLSALRRAELHLQVAEALEGTGASTTPRGLADLAHHFAEAAPVDGPERAVEYNLRAAAAATDALAFDEAVTPLRTALELGVPTEAARAGVELELGAALYRAGRSIESLEVYRQVAVTGRDMHDAELLARAAIGIENACWRVGSQEPGTIEVLEEALAALDPTDSTMRVLVLSGLSRALALVSDVHRSVQLRDQAIEMARRIDYRAGLPVVLMRAYWARGTDDLESVLPLVTEARDVAAEIGDIELQAEAAEWRLAALIALGELSTAAAELADVLAMARRMHQPFPIHVAEHYGSLLALCHGDLAESEAAAERSREWSKLLRGRDASGVYGVQMFSVRREQGRLAELAPVVRVLAGRDRRGGAWRPGLAALMAELGMYDEARSVLAQVNRDGLALYRQGLWAASLSYVADACAAVSDAGLSEQVYEQLQWLAGGNVMVGHGVAFYGSADRYLGMLASTVGEHSLARRHLRDAVRANRTMGASTWLAHSLYEYARALAAAGDGDDPDAGLALAEAAALADRIGMRTLRAAIRALGIQSLPAGDALPDGLSGREAEILRLVAAGRSNRDIGRELHISEHTAANHVRSILRKTGCANRTEAASYAHTRGLAGR